LQAIAINNFRKLPKIYNFPSLLASSHISVEEALFKTPSS
jgi:hypothetical protein